MQLKGSPLPYDGAIISLLEQLGEPKLDYKGRKGAEVRIRCVLPGHNEKTPSLFLNRIKGFFHCYGCGRGGGLEKFARETGLSYKGTVSTYTSDTDPFAAMLQNMADMEQDFKVTPVKPPDSLRAFPPGLSWRGIPGKFLEELGAKLWFDEKFKVDRVWIPGYQHKELVGWFARVRSDDEYASHQRHVDKLASDVAEIKKYVIQRKKAGKKDEKYYQAKKALKAKLEQKAKAELFLDLIPKYYNNPNMKAKKILFPWDFVRKKFPKCKSIVLVEGQVDALYLIYMGIPALAILGTNNWSKYKETTLVSGGYDTVVLAMDGDKSGRKAQKAIRKELQDKVPRIRRFRCPSGKDPATLEFKDYKELKHLAGLV